MTESTTIQTMKRPAKMFAFVEAHIQSAIGRIAESEYPVLITGEHGVGKRSVAAQIHAKSRRARTPFMAMDSTEATEEGILSALSASGCLYLIEIGNLDGAMQEMIIQSYFRSEKPPNCRLLCGTSRELVHYVKTWRMREDFFHLVSAVTLRLSPLRCRKAEILSIANELLTQYARQFDRPKPVLCKEIVEFLMEHTWPGNLAEFETAIKTLVAIGDQSISLAALKAGVPIANPDGHPRPVSLKKAIRTASTQIERQLISEVLIMTGGNRKRAADELGISYKALLYKLKQLTADYEPSPATSGGTL